MNRVLAAVPDMFFASKIRATAEHLGINVKFIRSIDALKTLTAADEPNLILVDLQATTPDPFELAHAIRADKQLHPIPMLGFYSHLLTELQEQAKQAGFTYVMPRSAFTNKLADILTGKFQT